MRVYLCGCVHMYVCMCDGTMCEVLNSLMEKKDRDTILKVFFMFTFMCVYACACVCMCFVYVYIYIHMCIHIYVYIHTHTQSQPCI